MSLKFSILHNDGDARCGRIETSHGVFDTPAFMPVGTAGSVKGVTPAQLRQTGARMILGNTYHLQLRPGAEVVAEFGGLHRFMGWDGPILTDSGGYQVFSLARINRVSDDGVEFRSHVDGAPMRLDPVIATTIQRNLGSDVIMAFDQCPALPSTPAEILEAVERTVRWARVCREVPIGEHQSMFGIVQGGLDLGIRRQCQHELVEIGFDGYAIGGLSVGESFEEMVSVLRPLAPSLPADKPRYLMGVGMPRDIVAAVQSGVDMFDCVLPTRNGRNAYAFTAAGPLKMRNECHRLDDRPLEEGCDCEACGIFSRGYIRHLFNCGEMLGPTLTSIHNLRFFQRLMERIRALISVGRLASLEQEYPIVGQSKREVEGDE